MEEVWLEKLRWQVIFPASCSFQHQLIRCWRLQSRDLKGGFFGEVGGGGGGAFFFLVKQIGSKPLSVMDTESSSLDTSWRDLGGTGGGSDPVIEALEPGTNNPSLLCIESLLLEMEGDLEWFGVLVTGRNCPLEGLLVPTLLTQSRSFPLPLTDLGGVAVSGELSRMRLVWLLKDVRADLSSLVLALLRFRVMPITLRTPRLFGVAWVESTLTWLWSVTLSPEIPLSVTVLDGSTWNLETGAWQRTLGDKTFIVQIVWSRLFSSKRSTSAPGRNNRC